MDRRQSAADAAVHAADQAFPERGTGARWEPVRHSCYGAAEVYLALSAELEAAQHGGPPIPQGQQRVEAAALAATHWTTVVAGGPGGPPPRAAPLPPSATPPPPAGAAPPPPPPQAVDEFYRGDQGRLEEAVAVLGAVPQLVQQVKAAAAVVRTQAGESEFANYPSVRKGAAAVDEALVTLEAAAPDTPAGTVRETANRLAALTKELADALAQAPSRAAAANTAISSVTTRLAAVRTRAEGVPPAFSALLREFNAASSADLANNERESQRAIEAADAVLGRARAAAAENNPEFALDLTTSARGFLTEAEQRVDAVTKRLALLRAIRSDPQEQAKAVRFRLRDAQMLAVSRGLVAEWGSVLDAQAVRIDRISETLSGRHPDYWAYVAELDAVTEFIAGVVDRMRKQAGPRRE